MVLQSILLSVTCKNYLLREFSENPEKSRRLLKEYDMKKFLMLIAFVLTTSVTYGQDIADVSQSGDYLIVRDAENKMLSQKYFGQNETLCGFSSHLIVVRNSMTIIVYDQNFKLISEKYVSDNDKVKSVTGNNIIIKSGSLIITYDKNFKIVSERYE